MRYVFLLYGSTFGGVSLLNGSHNHPSEVGLLPEWRNISSKLRTQSNLQVTAPFSITHFGATDIVFASKSGAWTASYNLQFGGNEYTDGTDVQLCMYIASHHLSQYLTCTANCSTSRNADVTSPHDFDNLLLLETREHYINMWIENGTLLGTDPDECRKPQVQQPSTPFPYRRLTGFNDANSTAMVFYHQLNATAFAEEQWNGEVGNWDSSIIHIETA